MGWESCSGELCLRSCMGAVYGRSSVSFMSCVSDPVKAFFTRPTMYSVDGLGCSLVYFLTVLTCL